MKKIYSTLLLAATILVWQNANAQVYLGVYGLRTNGYNTKSPDIGGGFGFNIFSEYKAIPKTNLPLKFQTGIDFNYSGLGRRTFNNVPLTSQVGGARATLSNSLFTVNLLGQLIFPNKSIFTPYANAFAGYRGTVSNLTINPNVHYVGVESETQQTISSVHGLNYGVGAGILTKLWKSVQLDVGFMYNETIGGGRVTDLNTAYSNSNGINLDMKSRPNALMMIKVGLVFYIPKGKASDNDDCNCKCNRSRSYSSGRSTWSSSGKSSSIGVHIGGGVRAK